MRALNNFGGEIEHEMYIGILWSVTRLLPRDLSNLNGALRLLHWWLGKYLQFSHYILHDLQYLGPRELGCSSILIRQDLGYQH